MCVTPSSKFGLSLFLMKNCKKMHPQFCWEPVVGLSCIVLGGKWAEREIAFPRYLLRLPSLETLLPSLFTPSYSFSPTHPPCHGCTYCMERAPPHGRNIRGTSKARTWARSAEHSGEGGKNLYGSLFVLVVANIGIRR